MDVNPWVVMMIVGLIVIVVSLYGIKRYKRSDNSRPSREPKVDRKD